MKVWEKVSLKSSLGLASLEGSERGDAATGEEWTGALQDAASLQKKLLVIDHAERVNYQKAGVRLLSFEVIVEMRSRTNCVPPRP